jgi:hypothetical protein
MTDGADQAGPPFEMVVEWGKIREFARATQSDQADYLEDEQAVVPPTFLISAAFWQARDSNPGWRALNIDPHRLLHGDQEFVFFGEPPRAGDRLTAQMRIESVFEKEGKRGGTMRFAISVTDFTDESGRLVAQSRGTAIETGRPPA